LSSHPPSWFSCITLILSVSAHVSGSSYTAFFRPALLLTLPSRYPHAHHSPSCTALNSPCLSCPPLNLTFLARSSSTFPSRTSLLPPIFAHTPYIFSCPNLPRPALPCSICPTYLAILSHCLALPSSAHTP
ncbi:hypothetical protein V8E53_013561, partial [Lactarius tabidus]